MDGCLFVFGASIATIGLVVGFALLLCDGMAGYGMAGIAGGVVLLLIALAFMVASGKKGGK